MHVTQKLLVEVWTLVQTRFGQCYRTRGRGSRLVQEWRLPLMATVLTLAHER